MNDGKLKNLFEMLEPNVKKYKIPYQKSSDFFNSYQNNIFDSKIIQIVILRFFKNIYSF